MDNATVSLLLAQQIIFYIFLVLDISSLLCSCVLFYCYFRLTELRQQIRSNLMIIYLLASVSLLNVINIPLILPYFQNHYYIAAMKYPNVFCVFWIIFDYAMSSVHLWIIAILSLERYLLIFFKQSIVNDRKRRCFLYYILVPSIVLFLFLWYLCLVAFYPCEQTQFDYTHIICSSACYQTVASTAFLNFDWIISGLLPVFLTVFFTFILILHVLYQKHKIRRHLIRQETWRRTRKMFLQLLPITLSFLVFIMPLITVGLMAVSDPWYETIPYFYVNCLSYCLPLSIPFVILWKQKLIRRRLLLLLRRRNLTRITPIILIHGPPLPIMNV